MITHWDIICSICKTNPIFLFLRLIKETVLFCKSRLWGAFNPNALQHELIMKMEKRRRAHHNVGFLIFYEGDFASAGGGGEGEFFRQHAGQQTKGPRICASWQLEKWNFVQRGITKHQKEGNKQTNNKRARATCLLDAKNFAHFPERAIPPAFALSRQQIRFIPRRN